MKYQEKKFRVNDLRAITKTLEKVGAQQIGQSKTVHYYAKQTGSDVVKLVSHGSSHEIHILEESDGTFALKKAIEIPHQNEGFKWLKDRGHKDLVVLNMQNAEYSYKDGIVGLYTINDKLKSVILDFPKDQYETIEHELGLSEAEVIKVPYNKYLEQLEANDETV